jgi:site-specific recombinase XerC
MYIMVKTYQNLELLARDVVQELSILESRKHNQAVVESNSGGLQSRSTPKRIGSCRKASSSLITRGLRKSSSLTNGMSPGRNKTALREYGTEARGLDLSPFYNHLSMRPSWASADALSTAPRRRH